MGGQMQSEESEEYDVIRRVFEAIDGTNYVLSPKALARLVDLSPAQLQRVFSNWTGITTQKYQKYLTQGYAKTVLRDKCTTLMIADSLDHSKGGRMHNQFIRWEAMSTGDYGTKGADLTIYEGWFSSPFGEIIAIGTNLGLCGLGFASKMGRDRAREDLIKRWPLALLEKNPNRLASWVEAVFTGESNVDLHMMGTPLQIKVWEAMMRIPSGHVTTYSNIARSINCPKAVRAVSTAVGRNPIGFIIPCHRVLRKSGELGGYHWGTALKRAILAFEGAQDEAQQ